MARITKHNAKIKVGRHMSSIVSPVALALIKGFKFAFGMTGFICFLIYIPSKESYAVQSIVGLTDSASSLLLLISVLLGLYLTFSFYFFRLAKTFKVDVANGKLIIRKGFVFTSVVSLDLVNVMHAERKQSPIQRMFGVIDVKMFTHGDSKKSIDIHCVKESFIADSALNDLLGDKEEVMLNEVA